MAVQVKLGDKCPLYLAIARSFASYVTEHKICHYSQWFPCKEISVADAFLSRDFDLSDVDVASFVRDCFTNQIPQHFCLVRLPAVVITNVGNLLRQLPRTLQLPSVPAPSAAGASSSRKLDKSGTPSLSAWTQVR